MNLVVYYYARNSCKKLTKKILIRTVRTWEKLENRIYLVQQLKGIQTCQAKAGSLGVF